MTDDELRDTFHRFELRLDRIDLKLDALEKRLTSLEQRFASFEDRQDVRFDWLEHRLNTKAGNWTVSLWGATLAILIGLVRLWG
jgi:hypothetical protein